MKKVNNLDELVELIGMESVEKCFTEYMMLIIAKARKWDEMQEGQMFLQSKTPKWGDEMITIDDLSDKEVEQLMKNVSDIKSKKRKT